MKVFISKGKSTNQKNIFNNETPCNNFAKLVIPQLHLPKNKSIVVFPISSAITPLPLSQSHRNQKIKKITFCPKIRKYDEKRTQSVHRIIMKTETFVDLDNENGDYAKEKQYNEYKKHKKYIKKKEKLKIVFPQIQKKKIKEDKEKNLDEIEEFKKLKNLNNEKNICFKKESLNNFYNKIHFINKLEHSLKNNIGDTLNKIREQYNKELDQIEKSFLFSKKNAKLIEDINK